MCIAREHNTITPASTCKQSQSGEQVLVLGNFRVLADDRPNRFRLVSSNESIVRIPPKRLEVVLVFKMAILATRISIN